MVLMAVGTTGSFIPDVYHLLSGILSTVSANHSLKFWALCGTRSQQYTSLYSLRGHTTRPVSHTDKTPRQLAQGMNPP